MRISKRRADRSVRAGPSELVAGAGGGEGELATERGGRLLLAAGRVAPGNQVGDDELTDARGLRVLAGLTAGQMQVRRVVLVVEERGLTQEEIAVLGEPDELLAGTGVARVGQH